MSTFSVKTHPWLMRLITISSIFRVAIRQHKYSWLLLLLSTIGIIALRLELQSVFSITLGAPNQGVFVRGFFPTERTPEGLLFRWSTTAATFWLPDTWTAQILRIQAHSEQPNPTDTQRTQLTLQTDKTMTMQITMDAGWRTYWLLLPPVQTFAFGPRQITLRTPSWLVGARELGIPIATISLTPVGSTLPISLTIAVLLSWQVALVLWVTALIMASIVPKVLNLRMPVIVLVGILLIVILSLFVWHAPLITITALHLHIGALAAQTATLFVLQSVIYAQQAVNQPCSQSSNG
jgi:hypothetical protein